MKTQAIIPAAGIGARLKTELSKPLVDLCGKPLCVYALEVFEQSPFIESVILVGHRERLAQLGDIVRRYGMKKVAGIVAGGATRRESVANGLAVLDEDTDVVMVHDAARPLVSLRIVGEAAALCRQWQAVVAAVPVKPAVKRVNKKDLCVEETLDRDGLWEVQTPQVFRRDVLIRAHAQDTESSPADDAAMVERLGIKVKIVQGDYKNIKITTQEDLTVAETFLKSDGRSWADNHGHALMGQRIGIGYDIHRLGVGRRLVLGGVEIPHEQGLEGHSDADVLVHAVCDAVLGALGKGDIGEHFPDTDARYKDISSLVLLEKVKAMAGEEGYRVGNVDCVIQAEEPILKEYKPRMRLHIARALAVDEGAVNIKATTQERLGAVGRKEGIAAFASVVLIKGEPWDSSQP